MSVSSDMDTEIEAKLKVGSLDEVKNKLTGVGAEFLAEQLHKDYYFDDADRTLTKTDRCLRLRRLAVGKKEKVLLTYKGAKEKDNFKKRKEVEIEVSDFESICELLSGLGYEKALVFEKRRRVWRLGKCEVTLDELPLLGSFVEIEGSDDREITDVQTKLALANLPHIPESYADLMAQKLSELGSEQKKVYL